MSGTRLIGPFLLALGLAHGVAAQERPQGRPVSGTVTDSATGGHIAGALVSVRGAPPTGVLTRENGSFVIFVPEGEVTLLVRSIGYRSKEVRVAADQSQVDIALVRDVFRLEEIVITGQATGVARRNLANAIATVSAEDLGAVPTASIEHQLQGKVAGADIQSNSGAPGGGLQVRLRGITSINADAQPLYVVDGVIVSDVAIPSNQNEVTAASGGSNPALTQDAQVNRIADLNPADIETIEILKGASASAIYGGRASNGVVIITTRRGQVGAPRINFTQRFGFFDLSNKMGLRQFRTAAEVAASAYSSIGTPGAFFDHEQELAGRNALSFETSASVSGGTENTQYFASGTVKNDEGIIANTGFQRQALRLNLDQRLSRTLNASLSTNLIHTLAQRGLTNNDNSFTSFYMNMAFTPSIEDLQPTGGAYPASLVFGSNPLQTAALMQNDENVWRFIGSGRLTWELFRTPTSELRFIGTGGVDFFNQENALYFPPELHFEPQDGLPGTSLLSHSNVQNLNLDGNLVHVWNPAGRDLTATTSAGIQYARRGIGTSRVTSRNLPPGIQNVDAGTVVRVRQLRQRVLNLGYYLQEEILTMGERLLFTAGLRADQSSVNADSDKLFFYPKASVSYRLERPASFLDELKLRLAYGESGNQPVYGQQFTALDATTNIGGLPGLVVSDSTGAADLHPERQREVELGFDAQFSPRASLEFTVFQKNISDLLLRRTLAPSMGVALAIFNGKDSRLRTRGVEIALGLVPIQAGGIEWFSRTTFSATRSTITKLEVPEFFTGGFGTSIGAFLIQEGSSATQIVGNDTLSDGSIQVVKIGDANPDFRMSFSNDFTWGRWNLHTLLDLQQGSSVLNLTKLLWDFGGVTADCAEPDPNNPAAADSPCEQRLAGFGTVTRNYLESASFLKLREITLSYDLPAATAQRLWGGVRSARLSVSGRNLFTSTPYTGLDPEVSNFGNQPVARNIDVAPFPPSRSFWFSIDLGF